MDNVTPSAHRSIYSWLAKIAVILALIVIMLGAYTRLKDAGLGCPDWPGCYGKMLLPQTTPGLQAAQMAFPHLPLEPQKAWAEMIHRYFAGTLGVLILILTVGGIGRRLKHPEQPIFILGLMVFLVIFQAVLGMWTVTWKLLPLIVTAHLMMGMTLAGCLMWVALKSCPALKAAESSAYSAKPWIVFGLLILGIQIFLGAWTSTHYAALACPHFPTCQGKLFPPLDWASAFNLLNPIGPNYEGGKLTMMARVTIHMAHRYWAFFTLFYFFILCLTILLKKSWQSLHKLSWAVLLLLLLQVTLGILNVEWSLPLHIAVAHNGVAAILLLIVLALLFKTHRVEKFP